MQPEPEPDPIDDLFLALQRDGKPTLPWIVRWSQDTTRDPVLVAWERSASPEGMVGVLALAGLALLPAWVRLAAFDVTGVHRPAVGLPRLQFRRGEHARAYASPGAAAAMLRWRMARAVRDVFPVPPTLETLLRLRARPAA